jgi:hypothetical protein
MINSAGKDKIIDNLRFKEVTSNPYLEEEEALDDDDEGDRPSTVLHKKFVQERAD